MEETITCQGRSIGAAELGWLNNITREHPDGSRHRITKHICMRWDWKTHAGQLKTFAARSLVDKLEQKGLLMLPPIRVNYRRPPRPVYPGTFKAPQKYPMEDIALSAFSGFFT